MRQIFTQHKKEISEKEAMRVFYERFAKQEYNTWYNRWFDEWYKAWLAFIRMTFTGDYNKTLEDVYREYRKCMYWDK